MTAGALTPHEERAALRELVTWPRRAGRELLRLPRAELDVVALLAGELAARPCDRDGWPLRDRAFDYLATDKGA